MDCFDNLESIPNITSVTLQGKFEAESLSKIVSFLEENPQYQSRMKLGPRFLPPACRMSGKPHVLKNLLNKLANLGIDISVKLSLIISFTDLRVIDKTAIQNAIKNPPEQLKQYTLGGDGDDIKLWIKRNGSCAFLFSSGRLTFSSNPEKINHITFRDEIIKVISEYGLGNNE
jgi:hypothetical protein